MRTRAQRNQAEQAEQTEQETQMDGEESVEEQRSESELNELIDDGIRVTAVPCNEVITVEGEF